LLAPRPFPRRRENRSSSPCSFPFELSRLCRLYTLRTDALDSFTNLLVQRFTSAQILEMVTAEALVDMTFSPGETYCCVVGFTADN